MVNFLELSSKDFENSIVKNRFIQSTCGEWIWFVDASITAKDDIETILQENEFLSEYDTLLFCSEDLDGEIELLDLLIKPQCRLYAFGVKRQLLVEIGSFNQLLEGCTNYEFLLRAAENGTIFAISCSAEKKEVFDPMTMAYAIRRYMPVLKKMGMLNEVFLHMLQVAERNGRTDDFNEEMNCFLQDVGKYEKLVEETAPILLFIGAEVWCGILTGFANSLAQELVALGQAVITTNNTYGNYQKISTEKLMNQQYKAIIGFQAAALEKEMFQNMKGKKVQFWFDDPLFFDEFFRNHSKETFILCQDSYYADYIREHYDIPKTMQFPPGGTPLGEIPNEKLYDVVFIGGYEPLSEGVYEYDFQNGFYHYMRGHVDETFEQGMIGYLKLLGQEVSKTEIREKLQSVKDVCLDILHRNRHDMVEKILCAGIPLHVYGDSWLLYKGACRDNLIIHPHALGEEALHIWSQAKIGLNMMRGHKAGMTERIANIMLSGACCLSDETLYLNEHFIDGEDIVLFKRSELDELPRKIQYLLTHDEEREKIAMAGRQKALQEHTWRKRAEQLLEMLCM